MYKPEYIEAIQKEAREWREEGKKARFQKNLSIAFNIAFIICIITLGQQIEKLSGIITGL